MDPLTRLSIAVSLLLLFAVLASKGASRFGIPSLLAFLGVGMLAGAGGPGGIEFAQYGLAQNLGMIALAFILFSGGLDTDLSAVKPVLASGLVLATAGVLISTALVAAFAVGVLGFSPLEGALLGATVSATDVAAVFTVLRGRGASLKSGLKPLLELESAVNDPITVLLSVGILMAMQAGKPSPLQLLEFFFLQTTIGVLAGFLGGRGAALLINRIRLEFEGLYPVVTLAWMLLIYGVAQAAHGSGFLAVYVAGITLGSSNFLHKRSLIQFHDAASWIMQIAMFLVMGLLVIPRELFGISAQGLALSIFLVLAARPASVFVSLALSRFGTREKLMISWGGLRGAVPIILATYPLTAQIPHSRTIFHLVFFVVMLSVLFQGTTIPWIADRLGVTAPGFRRPRPLIELDTEISLRNELLEVEIPRGSSAAGKSLLELRLPHGALVVLIERKGEIIVPRGSTRLDPGDTVLLVAEREALAPARAALDLQA